MTNTIHAPFGAQDVQEHLPTTGHTVTITVKNMSTFVKVGKLAANTTINVSAAAGLRVGATLVVRTFNVNGATRDILWGTGFHGATIDGVANTAHYATFIYDGSKFVQTSVQPTTREELETVSVVVTGAVDENVGTFVSTYTNNADVPNAWVVDSVLTFSPELPVGAEIALSGLTGNYEILLEPASVLWLSDIIEAHTEEGGTRGKLNATSSPATFIATLSGLLEDWVGDLSVRVVVSNTTTEGSYEADEEMTNTVILGELKIDNLTLDADVVD